MLMTKTVFPAQKDVIDVLQYYFVNNVLLAAIFIKVHVFWNVLKKLIYKEVIKHVKIVKILVRIVLVLIIMNVCLA